MVTAGARFSAWISAPPRPRRSGPRSCASSRAAGLRGVKLVISDAHEGIKPAVAKVLNATWQRCRVHYADFRIMPTDETNLSTMGVSAIITRHNPEFRTGHSVPVKASRMRSRGVMLFIQKHVGVMTTWKNRAY
jgi:Transposase, Mutator family